MSMLARLYQTSGCCLLLNGKLQLPLPSSRPLGQGIGIKDNDDDNGDFIITITTSEITTEEIAHLTEKPLSKEPMLTVGSGKEHNLPVSKKKPFKQAGKQRSHKKPYKRRDGKEGRMNNKRRR
ncbi:hypothetical protein Ancab_005307 [Ancistrocladus abbreviatus]